MLRGFASLESTHFSKNPSLQFLLRCSSTTPSTGTLLTAESARLGRKSRRQPDRCGLNRHSSSLEACSPRSTALSAQPIVAAPMDRQQRQQARCRTAQSVWLVAAQLPQHLTECIHGFGASWAPRRPSWMWPSRAWQTTTTPWWAHHTRAASIAELAEPIPVLPLVVFYASSSPFPSQM